MNRIGLLRLAILLVLLVADSPLSLASHAHETYDATANCVLCSFAATAVALTSQPARMPPAIEPVEPVQPPSQRAPDGSEHVVKRTRAPPAHSS